MVVLAIIVSVMSIVLTGQSTFNKTLILSNTTYDIALSLRSAETYGLGGHAVGVAPTGYGIHFDKTIPGSFILFGDSSPGPSTTSVCHPTSDVTSLSAQPGDCSYTAGQDTVVSTYVLGNNMTISDFCAYFSGSWSCATSHGSSLSALDIVFSRPNPDTLMSANGSYSPSSPVTGACITVSSPQGGWRFISVSSSGQIDAGATQCP